MSPITIFFCYAREDEVLLDKLKAHLKGLQRQNLIDIWHDRDISAGSEWELEIKKYLNLAQIILLLISPDFMNSDYCYSVEMEQAIARHEQDDAHVIPIILRPVYWQGTILGKLQALPTDAKPVISSSWYSLDDALFDVAEGIRKRIITLHIQQAISQGEAYSSSGQHKKALAVYEEALLIAPDNLTLLNNKGSTLFDLEKYSEALDIFNQMLVLNPKDVYALNNKGALLGCLNRHTEALTAFDQAVRLDPSDAKIYKNKSLLLEKIHRYPDALAAFEQAFELDHRILIPRLLYVKWAKKLLEWTNVVFLEIDTTGLGDEDEIIRILLVSKKGEVLFDTFVCADKDVSEEISYFTGISNEDLEKAPAIIDIWEDFVLAVQGKYVISFNLEFDQEMLEATAERYNLELLDFKGDCLMRRAMMYSHSFSYSRLSALCSYIGQPLPECPHQSALDRTKGQIAVLNAISQNMDIEEPYLEDEYDIARYIDESTRLFRDQAIDSRYTKFTKQALNVLKLAQKEDLFLQGDRIITEEILLCLLNEAGGVAAKVFASLGILSRAMNNIIEDDMANGNSISTKETNKISYTENVVERAIAEATNMNHFYVGTEHLLLGFLCEKEGQVTTNLSTREISYALAKDEIVKIYNQIPSNAELLTDFLW